jgi:hypothetical protein
MNREIVTAPSWASALEHYQVELSSDLLDSHGQLIDRVIDFAFKTLGASHFDLRATAADRFGEPRESYTRTQLRS